jgi:hypothetical protein
VAFSVEELQAVYGFPTPESVSAETEKEFRVSGGVKK